VDFSFSAVDEAFRAEVRAFIATQLPPELAARARENTTALTDKDVAMHWQTILVRKGWAVPSWPVQHGGTNWTPTQKYIFSEECAKAGAPPLIALGLNMLAPVLFRYGTDEQKRRYLPRILSGEDYWCQGYSEPGSGSDLSSLKTRAVKDGDDYIVNGTKIWTTHAHLADHIFCLVRTQTGGKPQAGITFLLIDMATPGITVRPIVTLAGDHEVNQVFFEDARVPQGNRLGPENEGWTVAKYLLEFERGGIGASARLKVGVTGLRTVAQHQLDGDGAPLSDDATFSARIDALEIRVMGLEFAELSALARLSRGGSPGPESSLHKNTSADIGQCIETLLLEAIDYQGLPHARTITCRYLNGRAASIFGGAREVQKNIVAKVVLGL